MGTLHWRGAYMAIEKRWGRKGFMFTLVAIFLIAIFVFVLYTSSSHVFIAKEQLTAERTEGIVMNMYTESFRDHHLDTFIKVAGRNALHGMVDYVDAAEIEDGEISDPEDFARRVFMNGTVEASYDMTSESADFDMTLLARNGSDIIKEETMTGSGSTLSFGSDVAYAQYVIGDNDDPLDSLHGISLTITNSSGNADSDDLYIVVYNESYAFVALDHQNFVDEDGDYEAIVNFTFGADLPFDGDHGYYILLAAPFVSDYYYDVDYDSGSALEQWDIMDDTSGTFAHVPLDFYLGGPRIKEGFLLGLVNGYARFGWDTMNIYSAIDITDVTVEGKDPWHVKANATVLFSAEKTTVSYTDLSLSAEEDISILGLVDPYNLMLDWNLEVEIANQSLLGSFDEDNLYKHINEHTFIFNENATSYLERFSGSSASKSTCCGIQTILTYDDISGTYPDEEDRDYSYIDHKFRDSSECDVTLAPLYYLTYSGSGSLGDVLSSQTPLFDYASITFYHIDDMSDVNVAVASCPS
jgi:hypothetical protein